jgi:hypothetical protein
LVGQRAMARTFFLPMVNRPELQQLLHKRLLHERRVKVVQASSTLFCQPNN